MELKNIIYNRYSCRSFLDKQIKTTQIYKIVALAQQAPSWGNTQPWKIYATTGAKSLLIRKKLVEAYITKQPPEPDILMPTNFNELLMNRYQNLGKKLFKTININQENEQKRKDHYINNYNAFGAPALIYITTPIKQTPYVILDAGAFITIFCLAASEIGLATCILASLARYPKIIRTQINIPNNENVLIGLALGYPNTKAQINQFRSERTPIKEIIKIINS